MLVRLDLDTGVTERVSDGIPRLEGILGLSTAPDHDHVAILIRDDDGWATGTIDLADGEVTEVIRAGCEKGVWLYDDRFLFETPSDHRVYSYRVSTGALQEIFDGSTVSGRRPRPGAASPDGESVWMMGSYGDDRWAWDVGSEELGPLIENIGGSYAFAWTE